jgi:hypothetical protein
MITPLSTVPEIDKIFDALVAGITGKTCSNYNGVITIPFNDVR